MSHNREENVALRVLQGSYVVIAVADAAGSERRLIAQPLGGFCFLNSRHAGAIAANKFAKIKLMIVRDLGSTSVGGGASP